MPITIKTPPLPHHVTACRMIEAAAGRCILADDMGLGKTYCTLYYAVNNPIPGPIVVVCPDAVKFSGWEEDAMRHFGMRSWCLSGRAPQSMAIPKFIPPLIIINYDILDGWAAWLRALRPSLVILDECQNISNPGSKRSKAAALLCKGVGRVICASGTPIMNRPSEIWHALNILWPHIYYSPMVFYHEYCNPERKPWGWVFNGAKNLDKLHAEIKELGLIRRLKRDTADPLTPLMRRIVPVPMADPEEYRQVMGDFKSWINARHPDRAARALKAEELTRLNYALQVIARQKVRAVKARVAAFMARTDEKLVVFAKHKKMVAAIQRPYHGKSIRITGQVTGRVRASAIKQFKQDPACRLAVCNIAGAAGLNGMQHAARHLWFSEFFWRPTDHMQAEGRVHRLGQIHPVKIEYLVALGTIEEDLCDLIQEKQEVCRALIDGGGGEQLNLADLLIDRLRTKGVL